MTFHCRLEYIEVGYGPVMDETPFMAIERTGARKFDINYLGIATGWGSDGVWEFMENSGN